MATADGASERWIIHVLGWTDRWQPCCKVHATHPHYVRLIQNSLLEHRSRYVVVCYEDCQGRWEAYYLYAQKQECMANTCNRGSPLALQILYLLLLHMPGKMLSWEHAGWGRCTADCLWIHYIFHLCSTKMCIYLLLPTLLLYHASWTIYACWWATHHPFILSRVFRIFLFATPKSRSPKVLLGMTYLLGLMRLSGILSNSNYCLPKPYRLTVCVRCVHTYSGWAAVPLDTLLCVAYPVIAGGRTMYASYRCSKPG
jgi:hypothetical protein